MSLKAIAKTLGISVTTVSRALNGYSDVAADTRAMIQREADRLGYRPNALARRLKMGKTDAVALVYPARPRVLNNSAFLEMISCISQELASENIDLLLVSDVPHHDRQAFIRLIESRRVDALIVAHTLLQDPRLDYLSRHQLPFLALGRSQLPDDYAWFDFDNRAGSMLAVDRLAALGHRRIAWLGSDNPQTYVKHRLQGYQDAMRQAGLEYPAGFVIQTDPNRRDGYQQTRAMLALEPPPTAIVADCNMLGEGAAHALLEAGLLQKVALIAYDGLPAHSLIPCEVTPIIQATKEQVGKQIAQMTMALISGESPARLQVLWQPELGEGETCFAPLA